jgi:hypothetical protein
MSCCGECHFPIVPPPSAGADGTQRRCPIADKLVVQEDEPCKEFREKATVE